MKNIKLEDKEQKTYQTKIKGIGIRNTKWGRYKEQIQEAKEQKTVAKLIW